MIPRSPPSLCNYLQSPQMHMIIPEVHWLARCSPESSKLAPCSPRVPLLAAGGAGCQGYTETVLSQQRAGQDHPKVGPLGQTGPNKVTTQGGIIMQYRFCQFIHSFVHSAIPLSVVFYPNSKLQTQNFANACKLGLV